MIGMYVPSLTVTQDLASHLSSICVEHTLHSDLSNFSGISLNSELIRKWIFFLIVGVCLGFLGSDMIWVEPEGDLPRKIAPSHLIYRKLGRIPHAQTIFTDPWGTGSRYQSSHALVTEGNKP